MDNNSNTPKTPAATAPKTEPKKGLGRGLAALLGGDDESPFVSASQPTQSVKSVASVAIPPEAKSVVTESAPVEKKIEQNTAVPGYQILNVDIEKVSANEDQPRQHFVDAKIQELAESICEQGLIQPIIVRTLPDQSYQIVAGERRWRACKMLGMTEIPVIIREEFEKADNSAKADLASVIENIQRVELNPVELSEAYSKILKNYNFTQDELAKKLGVSRVSVANTLRLQKLPREVKDLIVQSKITEGHGRALLALEKEEEITLFAQQIVAEGLTVREVESRVRIKTQGPAVSQPQANASAPVQSGDGTTKEAQPAKSAEMLAMEEDLRGIFGTKAVLRGNTKGGVIELYYSNEDSLHRLVHQLRTARST
ncbi:MAG: ParB/RepB/Spo0J family partition protein [Bdellovibrionota bacterium]